MIEGINKVNQPYLDSSPTPPINRIRQAEKSSLSSSSESQTSCLKACGSILWTAVKIIFFPITLSYYFFKNIFSTSMIDTDEPSQATFGVYGAPYPTQARTGPHERTIEEAEGFPIQLAAKASRKGNKVAFLVDTSREESGLIAQLQLHRMMEKGMAAVDKGAVAFLENLTCKPADIGGDANSGFRANIIIAKATPYSKGGERYIFQGRFIDGFNGKQINHLRESLRGQLFVAHKNGAEVIVLEHFGSHQGTPSTLIRGVYDQLLEEEFAGCFKKVIFVKREDDDAHRASDTATRRTARDAVQLKDLKS